MEIIPRRGTFVRAASQDDLAEVYLVRLALEGTAAAHAYPRLHADPTPLREALEGMRAAAAAGDAHGIAKFSTDFHRAVITATGNRLMMEIWDSLFVEARTMATVVRGHVDLHAAAEAHVPILEAFEHGTPEDCTRLVTEHQHEYSILPQD